MPLKALASNASPAVSWCGPDAIAGNCSLALVLRHAAFLPYLRRRFFSMGKVHPRIGALFTCFGMALVLIGGICVVVVVAAEQPRPTVAKPVDYASQIKPILTRHCVSCHGAVKPRGGLRLDTAAAASRGARAGRPSSRARAAESPLVAAVRGEGATERMPLNRPPLAGGEIKLLEAWIDQGAKAMPGEQPGVPPEPVALGVRSTGEAGRSRRRAAGLGAKPDRPLHPGSARSGRSGAVAGGRSAHLAAPGQPRPDRPAALARGGRRLPGRSVAPAAMTALVDRLLASPHFGERWARPWLDQARYADSNGYNIDAPRSIWKYRDWVIAAFNADMPFDQFAIDQIAGDLRPAMHSRPADRHRVSPQYADQPGRGDRRRAVPGRVDRRPGQHHRDGLPRPDDRLRPVPRPQVRPDLPARVLPALRLLQQRGRARARDRHAGGAGPTAGRSAPQIDELHRALAATLSRPRRARADAGRRR